MSSSQPETTIFLDDDSAAVERKVKRAVSGGRTTVEEHRREGGDCERDVAFQYLRFFFESDDEALAEIRSGYESGRLLSGDVKRICTEAATAWLEDLAEKRDAMADSLDLFLAEDAR